MSGSIQHVACAIAMASTCGVADATDVALGDFETQFDLGDPARRGAARHEAAAQRYELWFGDAEPGADEAVHFVGRALPGDFILQAQVEFRRDHQPAGSRAGWMLRAGSGREADVVEGAVAESGSATLRRQRATGGEAESIELTEAGLADVIQLERRGRAILFSAARFGQPWSQRRIDDLDLPDLLQIGLFLAAPADGKKAVAMFRNVRLIRPAPPDFVPYRDYIGSRLELLDVRSGERELVHQSDVPFEAPNWLPDGTALIYNVSGSDPATRGRLWRFDLATRTSHLIDTGFAIRNNNDHVLSFDGRMLGISDQSTDAGESTIFTLPVEGGTPKRITPNTPSYLHGWSPDGKWLTYTGGRDGEWDIYRIASDGSGDEVNLSRSPGLDDGPEYSPDGAWIYFNSSRTGRMQLWRMQPDGANPQRVTHDPDYNDWFPHLSPDGRWIAMLSYGTDVAPDQHPYYRHCYLRLMPSDGSATPRIIAYVYGGQGTINVPSWSPDGTRIAFVSNSDLQ